MTYKFIIGFLLFLTMKTYAGAMDDYLLQIGAVDSESRIVDSDKVNKYLILVGNKLSESLPISVQKDFLVDGVLMTASSITYSATLQNIVKDERIKYSDLPLLKQASQDTLEYLCDYMKTVKLFKNNPFTVSYVYHDKNGRYLLTTNYHNSQCNFK